MKTRIMILACLLAVPAGRMAAQQQTDPEQKATVQTQGDSIIIRKGKGDMRIKVYEEQLEDGEKKEVHGRSHGDRPVQPAGIHGIF